MSKALKLVVILLVVAAARDAGAQQGSQRPADTVSLAGPRVGVTLLSSSMRDTLMNDFGTDVGPVISQFGWQKEKRFLSSENGLTGVTEWVLLFGGMDQGVVIPSFSWLVGLRTIKGVEFAVGPNLNAAGVAMAFAGGVTLRTGNLNIPINLAAVPSKSGVRVSLLAGFNTRSR